MAALILDLMGAPAEVIADEYALTRIGTEPFREKLLPAAMKGFGGIPTDPNDIARGLRNGMVPGLSAPGMRELLSTRAETMLHFVNHLRTVHGGAYGYAKAHLGLSEADLRKIKSRLDPGFNA